MPEEHRFKNGHALIVVGFGSPEDHARAIAPVREGIKPLFELVTPIPFVALQQMLNKSSHWGTLAYEKALYLGALSDAAIAVIADHAPKKKSPLSFVPTFRLDGKYLARRDADSAFGGAALGWLRPQHRGARSARVVPRLVRSRPGLGAELLGRDAAARNRLGQLCEFHG